ncbi:MAG: cytochrome o ubiquinol oxidase subunit III [Methylomonas sp.]|jgi:cytochrome o ubiquinol oxidase subunit 3|uniref:cytochrome o ubiquinol oxidase subunit III n=1 Tax=Methylomonas sp. TaxID=418 RepID=UPI0025D89470|nr:cytochrome o ubiquinol oxidase subunit III [Methylomonas sp.]MCK9605640.1 cytochrome o ubiquinol oxidase subunit III [Methylomonas sp.]
MTPISQLRPTHAEAASAAKIFGFWAYLMSDAVIFALLFATYVTMSQNLAGGPTGKQLFDLSPVFYETLLLLFSTLSCGFAMLSLSNKQKPRLLIWLGVTFALGLGFLLQEYSEFDQLIGNGAGPDRSGFLSAFFTLVGTHGLHVGLGLIWLLVMMAQIILKGITLPVASRLYRFSLFWHFLDLIWVSIFSVIYLPGVL